MDYTQNTQGDYDEYGMTQSQAQGEYDFEEDAADPNIYRSTPVTNLCLWASPAKLVHA